MVVEQSYADAKVKAAEQKKTKHKANKEKERAERGQVGRGARRRFELSQTYELPNSEGGSL